LATTRNIASLAVGVGLAFLLWYMVFLTGVLGSFWLRVTLASAALALYASVIGGVDPRGCLKLDKEALAKGALSGALLYAFFALGFSTFRPFVERSAAAVYQLKGDSPVLAASALIVTSICEEYFWRLYVQRALVAGTGRAGLALSTLAYALIHLPTLNAPLVFAALTAGLCWGLLYDRTGSFGVVAASHIVWTELVFVFLPLG